jgi:KRAB domain-containing zinc finger protein
VPAVNNAKLFSCPQCSKTFDNKSKLDRHLISHTGDKPFGCQFCDKSFPKSWILGVHRRKFHAEEATNSSVEQDASVVKKTRLLNCQYCCKFFEYKSTLNQHMRVHTGEKPYSCTVCGKSFALRHQLVVHHHNIHAEEVGVNADNLGEQDMSRVSQTKLFSCQQCSKFFACKYRLDQHMTVHTGEKQYMCTWCGKSFARKHLLKQHMRAHTGEKPYSCGVCGKSFAWRYQLVVHHQNIHAEEVDSKWI